jgi:hypothetical protein
LQLALAWLLKRGGSSGRVAPWRKIKNPGTPAVRFGAQKAVLRADVLVWQGNIEKILHTVCASCHSRVMSTALTQPKQVDDIIDPACRPARREVASQTIRQRATRALMSETEG